MQSKMKLRLLKREFKLWRRTRKGLNSAIPARLWAAACGLCEELPLNDVRSALAIDYNKLKAKVAASKSQELPIFQGK